MFVIYRISSDTTRPTTDMNTGHQGYFEIIIRDVMR